MRCNCEECKKQSVMVALITEELEHRRTLMIAIEERHNREIERKERKIEKLEFGIRKRDEIIKDLTDAISALQTAN